MKRTIVARRQVLRGAGGFTLGLPFLPSLASRAFGQSATPARVRRFIAMTTEHGAVHAENMSPGDGMLTSRSDLYTGHTIRHGTLTPTQTGGNAVLSPVLTAPSNLLTPRLVAKLNVLRGLDAHCDSGHHQQGVHLGNFAVSGEGVPQCTPRPTVDQVMAWSPSFYPTLNGIRQRSILAGQDWGVSWGYSNPAQHSGTVQSLHANSSTKDLFSKLIAGSAGGPVVPRRPSILDRIVENYRSLRNGNRRLSASDRLRLDDHLGRLAELERQLTAGAISASAACVSNPPVPAEANALFDNHSPRDIDGVSYFKQLNDVIVMAMACDTTRVVVMPIIATMATYLPGDWHQDVAHMSNASPAQMKLTAGLQATFQHIFLDLAAKLDAIESAPGRTLLDDSLIQWTQEAGPVTHYAHSLTVVTMGGAAGYFKTGNYVDYRRQTAAAMWANRIDNGPVSEYMGLAQRQWLGNVLKAMAIPVAEFDPTGTQGYGDPFVNAGISKFISSQVLGMCGQPMPIVAG